MNEIITQFALIKMLIENPTNEYEKGRNSALIKLLKDSAGLGIRYIEPAPSTTAFTINGEDLNKISEFKENLYRITEKVLGTSRILDKLTLFDLKKLYDLKDTQKLAFVKAFRDHTSCALKDGKDILDKINEIDLPF